jgi:hypothetical protein
LLALIEDELVSRPPGNGTRLLVLSYGHLETPSPVQQASKEQSAHDDLGGEPLGLGVPKALRQQLVGIAHALKAVEKGEEHPGVVGKPLVTALFAELERLANGTVGPR